LCPGKATADLLVEDNTQKGIVYTQFFSIVNKAELPEFVHGEFHVLPQAYSPGLRFPKDFFKKEFILGPRD
jgi:hypothetical protein